jgi:DNA-directed RNA polymerase specialized sigma24 family protein
MEPALIDALGEPEHPARLAEALESLPHDDRLAVQLFVVDELPAADVARIVGLPNAKAVYNRVYRALAELRLHLQRLGVSGPEL